MIRRRDGGPVVESMVRSQADQWNASSAMPSPTRLDVWDDLRREIARSRRYGHEFALIRIPARDATSARRSRWSRPGRPRDAAHVLRSLVRTLDYVWTSNGALYVLLPESDRGAGVRLLARIRETAPELLPEHGVRLAAFPADGVTSGALLKDVEGGKETGTRSRIPRRDDVATRPALEGEVHGGRRVSALHLATGMDLTETQMRHAEGT